MTVASARSGALEILMAIEKDAAYSTNALLAFQKSHPEMDPRDRALLTRLVYGVLERQLTLDYNLSLYLRSPITKLHPAARASLRVGAFQILFAERIPDSAAVNESVSLVKRNGCAYAAGLVNAVLRKVSANGVMYPDPSEELKYLSIKYSCPEKLIAHYIRDYGRKNTEQILLHSIGARPLFLRVNTLKTTAQELISLLQKDGITADAAPLSDALCVTDQGDITSGRAFRDGLFHVQDLSSQITSRLLGARPGETVVDCCAAPGGKTCTIAEEMRNEGVVYAFDLHENKIRLIKENAGRLGLPIVQAFAWDACKVAEKVACADRVLCDVPCSGFGVIGRKPEIKYKDLNQAALLPDIQKKILEAGASIVKPGGVLIYSTCTLSKAENDDVCDAFLASHPEFSLADDEEYTSVCTGNYMTVFPSDHGDGFFAAKFIRAEL